MRRTSANLLLLLAGAIWGMGFVAQSTAMDAVGPLTFLTLRFLLATLAVAPFAWREHSRAKAPVTNRALGGFIACGTALFVGMAVQQIGLLTTSVANSGFLTGLYVVFTPLLAVVLTRRRPHPVVWLAAASALIGIWLLSGGALVSLRAGDVLTVFCALAFAVQVILVGLWAPSSARPLALAFVQFAVCTVLGLVAAVLAEPVVWAQIVRAAPEILYAGILSSGLAFSLQVIGQRYTTAAQAAVFLSSEALFAALFGVLMLGEALDALRLTGCLFILLAILAVEIVPALLPMRGRGRHAAGAAQETVETANLSHSTPSPDA